MFFISLEVDVAQVGWDSPCRAGRVVLLAVPSHVVPRFEPKPLPQPETSHDRESTRSR